MAQLRDYLNARVFSVASAKECHAEGTPVLLPFTTPPVFNLRLSVETRACAIARRSQDK
jgi:hypothetical protein